jgi:hypothetical protein
MIGAMRSMLKISNELGWKPLASSRKKPFAGTTRTVNGVTKCNKVSMAGKTILRWRAT